MKIGKKILFDWFQNSYGVLVAGNATLPIMPAPSSICCNLGGFLWTGTNVFKRVFLWLFKKRNIHSYLHAFSHFDGRQDGLALFEILEAVAPLSLKHTQSYRDPDSDAHLSILSCIAKKWLF